MKNYDEESWYNNSLNVCWSRRRKWYIQFYLYIGINKVIGLREMQLRFYTVKKKSDKMQKYIKILHDFDFFYIPVYLQNFSLCKNTGINRILMYSIIVKTSSTAILKMFHTFLSFENKLKITSSLFFKSKVSKLYKQYLWKHEY